MPEFTEDTAGMGTLRVLEAIRAAGWPIRFYLAGRAGTESQEGLRPTIHWYEASRSLASGIPHR